MHPNALLDLATELLRNVLKFDAPADSVVSSFFRLHRALGARERHALAETVYHVLRRRATERRLMPGVLEMSTSYSAPPSPEASALMGEQAAMLAPPA